MASFIDTLFASPRCLLQAWIVLWVAFVVGLLLSHVSSNPIAFATLFKPTSSHVNHVAGLSIQHSNVQHHAAADSGTSVQHCQSNSSNPSCASPQHHSNDCLWQCLLVCMAHVLLFALCLVCGLKTRLLAYAKLPLCFKSSLLKRLLKPPKNSMVCA